MSLNKIDNILIINYNCLECGLEVKIIVNNHKPSFWINEHLTISKDVLTNRGFYICLDCHTKSNIRFITKDTSLR